LSDKEETLPSANGGLEDCNAENAAPSYVNAAKVAAPKRRSRRKAKRKRPSTKSCAREVALYDGQLFVAMIRIGADGKSIAFDVRGKRLGSDPTFQAASDALSSGGAVDG
jgi:hypothetical protein